MFNEAIPGPFPGTAQCLEASFTLGGAGLVGELLTRDSQDLAAILSFTDEETVAQRGQRIHFLAQTEFRPTQPGSRLRAMPPLWPAAPGRFPGLPPPAR